MLKWLRKVNRRQEQEQPYYDEDVLKLFHRAENALRKIIIPGFDVDLITAGIVRRLRLSGDTLVVFVDYTGSDPSCSFCRFINDRLWETILAKAREALSKEGFRRIVFIDYLTGREIL